MKYREFRADACVLDVLVRVAYPVFQEQFKGIIVRTGKPVKAILRPTHCVVFLIPRFDLLIALSHMNDITDLEVLLLLFTEGSLLLIERGMCYIAHNDL